MSVKTCPECGALITPTLERCRRCGAYLQGNRFEALLLGALPKPLRTSPGTGLFALSLAVVYLACGVIALPATPLAFSSYTLRHVGGLAVPSVLLGEWWRVVTSMFLHADVVHLAFNLYALSIVGPVVERLFDRKKMLVLTLLTGAGSMAVSFAWHFFFSGPRGAFAGSVGASGAVCGLIGAAWVGSLRFHIPQPHIAGVMRRWTVILVIWGFVVPGIDNAAHFGGLVLGAAAARFVPTGVTQSVGANRALSAFVMLLLAGVLASFVAVGLHARGYPASFSDDYQQPAILGFSLGDAPEWERSAQVEFGNRCQRLQGSEALDERLRACELSVRLVPSFVPGYLRLADAEEAIGNGDRADRLRRVAEVLAERAAELRE